MESKTYLKKIDAYNIRRFGFDTHSRVLGITPEEAKELWNKGTKCAFKRVPRTEYAMIELPEISTKANPFWQLQLPERRNNLLFYINPTAPVIVPDGFITDKGSIPLVFQNVISNYDREMMMAFLVHDVECEMQRMTRFLTDALIYEVGTEMGANWLKKNIIYTAVRAGNRYGKKDKIVNGFNVSAYNRSLIRKAEEEFISSGAYTAHLDFLRRARRGRDII
jgi:hypothetical protein